MARMKLEVVTPTGKVLETSVDSVTAPGVLGEFTVLPDHQPALIRLGGGKLTFEGGEGGQVLIRGGVAEIRHDGVLILADEAVVASEANRMVGEALLKSIEAEAGDTSYLDEDLARRLNDDRSYAEAILKVAGH